MSAPTGCYICQNKGCELCKPLSTERIEALIQQYSAYSGVPDALRELLSVRRERDEARECARRLIADAMRSRIDYTHSADCALIGSWSSPSQERRQMTPQTGPETR